ncbi:MAG: toll/interleukin-1 receptor domain-containing protein, partial [Spirochaetaceae bacterium]|nr:toll/interleukin-1 receptor domain-containing protein [Spirochaetaceae bacterium]
RLEQVGLSVFAFEYSIKPGQQWKQQILHAIRDSTSFLVVLSTNSIKSTPVMHEIGVALVKEKHPIVPLLVDITPDEMPDWIADRQTVSIDEFDEHTLESVFLPSKSASKPSALVSAGIFFGLFAAIKWLIRDEDANERNLKEVADSYVSLLAVVADLKVAFHHKQFTIDGRMMGDIGEAMVECVYDVEVFEKTRPEIDAIASDGKRVQIKATAKKSLTFKNKEDHYLGIQILDDGTFDEIFNGPASVIYDRFRTRRKGIGEKLLSLPISELRDLSKTVKAADRVPLR